MNFRDQEIHPVDKKGKRQILGVNEELPITVLEIPGNNQQRPPLSSFQNRRADDLHKLPVVIDSFGAINILPTDKFGAVQEWDNTQSSSFGSTYSRRYENTEESTGSFNFAIENKKLLEDVRGKYHCTESGSHSVNESGWEKKKFDYSTSAATSNLCSSRVYDGPHSSSTTYTCTLDERISNDNGNKSGGGPLIKRFCDSSRYNAQIKRTDERHVHFESPEPMSAEGDAPHAFRADELFPSSGLRQNFDTRTLPAPTVSHGLNYDYIDETRLQSVGLPSAPRIPRWPQHARRKPAQSLDLNESPKPLDGGDSRSSEYSLSSEDGFVREIHSNYKFASADRQAYLRQRMVERQSIQDATPVTTGLPETHGAERCRHVVSPEDLVWLNVRNYCGMVLDRETGAVLGTAVLFIPADSKNRKSAWVTGVNTVEGRWEVLIKDCKGEIQVAKLMLTSATFGLAFFSVRSWQKTFALAFLSLVTGLANLPHRLSVDVERGDQVYVFGYEEPWESEVGKIADIRVRPGKITDAGNMEIVKIDFTSGRLGGSITTPAGFCGGLVARADGLWAGIITGQKLAGHPSQIGFCSAYNIYSFLDELE